MRSIGSFRVAQALSNDEAVNKSLRYLLEVAEASTRLMQRSSAPRVSIFNRNFGGQIHEVSRIPTVFGSGPPCRMRQESREAGSQEGVRYQSICPGGKRQRWPD